MTSSEDKIILDRWQDIQKRYSSRRVPDPKTGRVLYIPQSVVDKEQKVESQRKPA